MTDRWQWVDAFREANIDTAVMMNMPEEDFNKCCRFLIDAGIAPLKYLNATEKKNPEQEELDKIIEESKKLKSKNQKDSTDYRYNPSTFTDQIYNINSVDTEPEENKDKKESIPKTYVWNEDDANEVSSMLSKTQESQYKELEKEQLQKQKEIQEARLEELKKNYSDQLAQSHMNQVKKENIEKADNLPPEPENGTPMAILLPNNVRITRKCDTSQDASIIYTIVEGQNIMYEKDDKMKSFKIVFGMNQELKRDEALCEQGIKGRTLFKVLEE